MPISVSELAEVIGVDDPERVFKGAYVLKSEKDRDRLEEIVVELIESSNYEKYLTLANLVPKCLTTMILVRVEAKWDPDQFFTWWQMLVAFSYQPSYARFVRDHPYAERYYAWLIQDAEKSLVSWEALLNGVFYYDS